MLSADFPALQTAIDEFAWKQMISRKLANAMLTVAEKLCVQTILLMLPDHGVVELVFEYSGENEEIRFRAEYGGEGGIVLENDTIPVRILKNTARDLVYGASDGRNRIEGRLC